MARRADVIYGSVADNEVAHASLAIPRTSGLVKPWEWLTHTHSAGVIDDALVRSVQLIN